MSKWAGLLFLCLVCAACSPRPGTSFDFVDGRPIYVLRGDTREECIALAAQRCNGAYALLEEGPVDRHRGGWVKPENRTVEQGYSVRVRCDSH